MKHIVPVSVYDVNILCAGSYDMRSIGNHYSVHNMNVSDTCYFSKRQTGLQQIGGATFFYRMYLFVVVKRTTKIPVFDKITWFLELKLPAYLS